MANPGISLALEIFSRDGYIISIIIMAVDSKKKLFRSLAGVAVAAVIVTALTLLIGHLRLVVTCEKSFDVYTTTSNKLQELIDSSQDIADITADEVLTKDRSVVNEFQSSYKKAKELLKDEHSDDKCVATSSNQDLTETVNELATAAAQMKQLTSRISDGGGQVQLANRAKKLDDATSALKSTLLSAKSLVSNSGLSQSVRSQLNKAVATAQSVLQSGDLDNIVSVRKQLDNIIDQLNESLSAQSAELAEIEQKVAKIVNQVDDEGSYTTVAVNILNTAGLREVWGLDQMRGACQITVEQASSWIAAFCSGTPNNIYINNRLTKSVTNDAYFADAMRHEVAHYLIYRRCGTSDPASIGSQANAESTASSYAVLYLGANANTLNRAGDARYHMNQTSDDAAARIHAGQCS